MKNIFCLLFAFILITSMACKSRSDYKVKDVDNPVISLNGTWKVHNGSYESIEKIPLSTLQWTDILVPGECMMQGFPIKHDQPFVYFTEFEIPADYKGKIIKLRFGGVYSYARVWVNGKYIRDHSGGFTAWECDITEAVGTGQKAQLLVEVTDKSDEISYASGYAKHQIGGILRYVSLMALPENYPVHLSITTDFDKEYKNALLIVEGQTLIEGKGYSVSLELSDSTRRKVELKSSEHLLQGKEFRIENQVAEPDKWDAEHPNLYKLNVKFKKDGEVLWQKSCQIGFREVEVAENKLLVNGRLVKLRGADRHDIHPLLGRMTTPEYDLQDVLLAKEANMNFIRTSHSPPSEYFLEMCDKYGIFVEDETAVCFVGSHRTQEYQPGASENSDDYTSKYLSQLEEMVSNHRNHPSVIIWSIGNENEYGKNFKLSYDWVKTNDPSRPVIFSYPGKVPDTIQNYDIISMHYPGTDGNMEQSGLKTRAFGHPDMPVLFDEWAHVACYNTETVREDPNVREFWGASLDTMWQRVFDADGGLGGAIWCMIDETFMLPADLPGFNEWWGKLDPKVIPGNFSGHTIGYGEWGFVDVWRRKKPEFWSVKKAYSPVRVLKTTNYEVVSGREIEIPVKNRYNFTNFNELVINAYTGQKTMLLPSPDIEPHAEGIIKLAADAWPAGESLRLEFRDLTGNIVESELLSGMAKPGIPDAAETMEPIGLTNSGNEYEVNCNNGLRIYIDKQSGLFSGFETRSGRRKFIGPFINARVKGKEIIYSSHTIDDVCKDWTMSALTVNKVNNTVVAETEGNHQGGQKAKFRLTIYPSGEIETEYAVSGLPERIIRERGIRFITGGDYDSLEWKRSAYWSVYPEGHLSGSQGNVALFTNNNNEYRKQPEKEWHYDKKSFFYNGIEGESSGMLTNMTRSTKENIFVYTLKSDGRNSIAVKANGDRSCRIEKTGPDIVLNINDYIDYPDISWGNYSRNEILSRQHSGTARIHLR